VFNKTHNFSFPEPVITGIANPRNKANTKPNSVSGAGFNGTLNERMIP
jgi:hypothetical protein